MREAAVIVPLIDGDRILFIKRTRKMRYHSGEISFPGGKLEKGEDYLKAAIREAHEELGIGEGDIEIIRRLPAVRTYMTNFHVVPFLAHLRAKELHPNRDEVERIIIYRIRDLIELERCILLDRFPYRYYIYPMPEGVIWGATARILHNLLKDYRQEYKSVSPIPLYF